MKLRCKVAHKDKAFTGRVVQVGEEYKVKDWAAEKMLKTGLWESIGIAKKVTAKTVIKKKENK